MGVGRTAVGLAALGFVGCSGGGAKDAAPDAGGLPCNGVSVAQWCPSGSSCDATWSAVLNDSGLCDSFVQNEFISDCGGYHVLSGLASYIFEEYFYDETSGALVAVTIVDSSGPRCIAGPSTGFVPPAGCSQLTSGRPPPKCVVDAGSDGGSGD